MEKVRARFSRFVVALAVVTATALAQPTGAAPGGIIHGDFLSQLLNKREAGWGMVLAGLAVAFCLGAIHALSPGHGKTIVAAYLVGTRGTIKHAVFLGGMVTFTHTISVFFLGFTTLFLSQYVLPEKIYPVLGAISGLSIVWIGAMLLYRRAVTLRRYNHEHTQDVHNPITSAGLAVVLMAIGVIVLYAKHLLPDSERTARHPAFRLIPVVSAALIVCIGLLMTGVSLGVIRPDRLLGLT